MNGLLLRLAVWGCFVALVTGVAAQKDSFLQPHHLDVRQNSSPSSSSSSPTVSTSSIASSTQSTSNSTNRPSGNITIDDGLRTCYTRDFRTGECRTVNSCSALNGTYETGYCPEFPSNIRCCLWGVCEIPEPVRIRGYCQRVSTCNGTSTPGWCEGPNDIQCCTHGNSSRGLNGADRSSSSLATVSSSMPTAATESFTSAASASATGPASNGGLSTGGKIGVGVGVSAGAVLLGLLLGVWWLLRRTRREKVAVPETTATVEETAGVPVQEVDHNALFQMATRDDVAELHSPVGPAELVGDGLGAGELYGDAEHKSSQLTTALSKEV